MDRRAVEIPELLVRAPDAVMLLDAQANVLDVNEEACRSLGYAREELLGKQPLDFVEGLDGAALAKMIALLKNRGVATFNAVHRRRDGTRFPVETRLALLRRGGPPVVVAFARDVSEQEAARRALRESEARYQRLVELLPDGVVTFHDRRITFANPAAARAGGVSRPEELVGVPVLDFVHADSREATLDRVRRVEAGEQVPFQAARLVRRDGSAYPVEMAAAPIGPGEAVAVVRDLTERERAETERAALEERLRQSEKLEALGTLAGGVAHDFNNVLAAILGHADTLASELPPGARGREDAEQIATAARRAKGVVQQILAFARRRPTEARPVDVAAAIREELPLVRAAMPAHVEIAQRLDPDAGAVRADPTHLHQILLNLSANARDAMQERGGRLAIEVSRAEIPGAGGAPPGLAAGRYVRLAVRDTGVGMDAATRARAFEPYFTTKPVGAGSGLGLAVVHGTAVSLGGAVSLESEPGRGTSVTVWLPRLEGCAGAQGCGAAAARAGNGCVLLVDDDPPVARAIARMLESLGYEVAICGDGASALERFRSDPQRFDAVITDQTLPGLCGDQLTPALLALRPELPVVICTGFSERLDEERARALGARALLMKPLDRAQLADALRAALAARRG
ncbi:MAG TPA: PAS domain S-box protein [Anaeromyxobacter sp.]|nr:PAS domain S-box protein [Anaeromyxobacter sp.]